MRLLALLPVRACSELVKSRKWRVLKNQIGRSVTVIELDLSFGPFIPARDLSPTSSDNHDHARLSHLPLQANARRAKGIS